MAIFAFPLFYFVKDERSVIFGDLFVTFLAGHVLMTAIQFKRSPVMIKPVDLP